MSLGRILEKLDDALNPIVVKELRQAVQSRLVVAALLFFLLVQLSVLGIILIIHDPSQADFRLGQTVFMGLHNVLLAICMLVIPAYAGIRLGYERSDTNVDLLFISTLRPRSIIWGKFFAALVLIVLMFSASAPFMTFTYLLRGISVPAILIVLATDFLAVVAGTQLAIFIAVVPANRFMKAVVGLLGAAGLVGLFFAAMGGGLSLVFEVAGIPLESWEFWAGAGSLALGVLGVVGLLFTWSVAIVTPPSANRALPVRLYLLGLWLVAGIILGLWSRHTNEASPMFAWLCGSVGLFALTMFVAINERDHWTPRVARTIPRRWWLRVPAFLLYSGSAGGVMFAVLMIGLTVLIAGTWPAFFPAMRDIQVMPEVLEGVALFILYTFGYALAAVLVRTVFLPTRLNPMHTWLLALVLVALGSAVPYLIGFLWFYNKPYYRDYHLWLLSNPFAAVIDYDHWEAYRSFAIPFAAVIGLLSIPWFVGQVRRFRPFESKKSERAAYAEAPTVTFAPQR